MKVSDPKNPSYLLIANDPEMESIIGALNALILNRLVTRVNTGQGKNIPVSIIVDELPTLYFHKIDRLIGTARSNKVSVALGFQELPQLEAGYVPLPQFYTFPSKEERERILYRNFVQVGMDVKEMIKDVVNRRGAK